MATIATLTVDLVAKSARFQEDLKKASKSANRFGDQVKRSAGIATAALAGIAAASAGVFAAMAANSARAIDALAKTSDKLGIATEKLAGLRHAAELTGVEQGKLDVALQRLTRRIAEAAQGTGVAVKALGQLGLSAQDLIKKSPDQALADIADAMQGVENQSDRVRIAFQLFDSEGVGLVNTLALGSEGLREAQREAEAFGIAITRVDAAKIEAANDSMTRAKEVAAGFGNALAVEVAPFIEAIANGFVDAAKEAGGFGNIAADILDGVVKGVGFAADALNGLKVVWLAVSGAATLFAREALRALRIVDQAATDTLNFLLGTQRQYSRTLIDVEQSLVASLNRSKAEFNTALNAEIPSTQIEAWAARVKANAEAAAQAVAESRRRMADRSGGALPVPAAGARPAASEARRQQRDAERAAREAERELRRQQQEALRQLEEEKRLLADLTQARLRLAQLEGGDTAALQARVIENQFADLTERLQARSDQAGLEIVRRLIDAESARARFEELESDFGRTMRALATESERIRILQESGLVREEDGRKRVLAIQRQTVDALRQTVLEMDSLAQASANPELIDNVEQIKNRWLEVAAAAQQSMDQTRKDSKTTAEEIKDTIKSWTTSARDAFVEFARTGKLEFSGLIDSIVADLARITIGKAITDPLSNALTDIIGGATGSLFGGGQTAGVNAFIGNILAPTAHAGAVIGKEATGHKVVSLDAFRNARRFHAGGLAGNEVPAILKKGEVVFTPEQARAMAPAGSAAPNVIVQPPNVSVNIQEAPGTRATVSQQQQADGGLRLDVVVEQVESVMSERIRQGRGLSRTFENAYGLNRAQGAG